MKRLTARVDEKLHAKFTEFAKSQVRSANEQLVWMVIEAVKKYEEEQERATGTNGV